MTHSLSSQIQAIQEVRQLIAKIANTVKMENKDLDARLNDAGSTIAAMNLTSQSAENAIERAKQTLRDAGYIVGSLFQLDDIIDRFKQNYGIHAEELSKEQARIIADAIEQTSDAEQGINWGTIDSAIENFVSEQEKS